MNSYIFHWIVINGWRKKIPTSFASFNNKRKRGGRGEKKKRCKEWRNCTQQKKICGNYDIFLFSSLTIEPQFVHMPFSIFIHAPPLFNATIRRLILFSMIFLYLTSILFFVYRSNVLVASLCISQSQLWPNSISTHRFFHSLQLFVCLFVK